jgi:hypothetical protein
MSNTMAKAAMINPSAAAQLSRLDLSKFAIVAAFQRLWRSRQPQSPGQRHTDHQGQPDQSHEETHDVAPASGAEIGRLW